MMWRAFMMMILGAILLLGCAEQSDDVVAPANAPEASDSNQLMVGRAADETTGEQSRDINDLVVGGLDYEAEFDPPGEPGARIRVFRDLEAFEASFEEVSFVGFQDLPDPGSSCPEGSEIEIPNPLDVGGIIFTDEGFPRCLFSGYSPHTIYSNGHYLIMHIRGTIEPPPETKGILFAIEGMGDGEVTFLVEAGNGLTLQVDAATIEGEVTYIGFKSPAFIQRLTQVWAGSHIQVVLTGVWHASGSDDLPTEETITKLWQ